MINLTINFEDLRPNGLNLKYPREYHSIATWLKGRPEGHRTSLSSEKTTQLIKYRYEILKKRYLNQSPQGGYKRLIQRLAVIILNYPPIERKFNHSANRQQFIISLTGQVLEYMLKHNLEVQKTLEWIEQITNNPDLRAAFVLASFEEYCCQLVNQQPLILDCLRQFLEQQCHKTNV